MRIVSANITGSLILNGVDVTDSLVSSSINSGSVSSKLDSLQSSTSSLNSFTSSYSTGSFTGSFKGDGTNLYNIPASGVTGLQLDKIASGAVTASVSANGFNVNSNVAITGSIIASGTSLVSGSSQINITGTTGYSTFSSSISTSIGSLSSSVASTTNTLSSSVSSSIGSLSSSVATTTSGLSSSLSSSIGSLSSSVATTTVGTKNRVDSIEAKTGSYATTGSNTFIGTENITGNLTVTGSVIISSGSAVYNSSLNLTDTSSLTLNSGSNLYVYDSGIISGTFKGSVTGSLGINGNVSITGSIVASGTSLVSGSSQIDITSTTNYTTFSSSVSSSIGNLSSSVATNTSGLSGRITTIEGRYATTGSNTFVGSQVITGSLYITNDMIVQGCSCLQNITASAVSIGTNVVMLNTATPAVRFAGISVQDSGSNAGVTGSIFWDGLCNKWIYSNPSNVGYSGGMLISGPRNTGTIGNESPLTCNYIAKSGGGDHIYDSCIIDDGTTVCINANLIGGGTACFSGSIISTTTYSSIISCSPIGCFGTICSPSHIGGTFSGTNIYASTVSCSPVGKFSNCIEVGGTGTFASNLTATGTITMNKTGGYGILAQDDGNNLAANGAYIGWTNSLNTRYFIGQLDTSNDLNYHYFNGSTWATSIMKFKNNGGATFLGCVGVGTNTPLSRFDVALSSGESLTIGNSSTTIMCGDLIGALTFVSRDASTNSTGGIAGIRSYATQTYNTGGVEGDLRFYTSIVNTQPNGTILSGSEVLKLSQDGVACFCGKICAPTGIFSSRVGIGETSPVSSLVVSTPSDTTSIAQSGIVIQGSSTLTAGCVMALSFVAIPGTTRARAAIGSIVGSDWGKGNLTFYTRDASDATVMTTSDEKMRITSGGFVGIGTSTPCSILTLRGTDLTSFTSTSLGNLFLQTGAYDASKMQSVDFGSASYPNPLARIAVKICSNGSHMMLGTSNDYSPGITNCAIYINWCGNVGLNTDPSNEKFVVYGGNAHGNVWLRLKTDGSHGIKPAIHFDSGLVGTNRPSKVIIQGGYSSPDGGGGGALVIYTNDTNETSQQRMCIDPRGAVTIMGALAKGSGSFRICHPLSSKVNTHALVHSFIEGPNADLIYSGHIKLTNGVACINIDCSARMTQGTFEALNRCVRIFTTNETSWDAVRGKVCGNMVVIESQNNTSEDEISWMVIGERQDQHMFDTEWTDSDGRVITEPEIVIVNDDDIV